MSAYPPTSFTFIYYIPYLYFLATSFNANEYAEIVAPLKYNYRGQLVYNGHTYSMHSENGNTCVVHWRCSAYTKFRCRANIKTRGKMLVSLRGIHSHPAKKTLKSCSPIVFKQV